MLIIGCRGSTDGKPENSLAGIQAAGQAGADMIHFSSRLTRDKKLILMNDASLKRTHGMPLKIRDCTLKELQKRTAGSPNPICTLDDALKEALKRSLAIVEIADRGSGLKVLETLAKPAFKALADNVLIASSSIRELIRVRNLNKKIKLVLLTKRNPFSFLAVEKRLGLSAVGFHRLYLNKLAIDTARKLDIFTFTYTVNRIGAVKEISRYRLDAIATNYPAKFIKHLS